jgi:hypothetical protein
LARPSARSFLAPATRAAIHENRASAFIEQDHRCRIPIQPFRADLLHRSERSDSKSDRQRPRKVALEDGKITNVVRLVPSGVPSAMQGNTRLHPRRRSRLTHHAKARLDIPLMPIVVGAGVVVALVGQQSVVNVTSANV